MWQFPAEAESQSQLLNSLPLSLLAKLQTTLIKRVGVFSESYYVCQILALGKPKLARTASAMHHKPNLSKLPNPA